MLFEVKRTSLVRRTKPHDDCIPMRICVETKYGSWPNKDHINYSYDGIASDGFVDSWGIEITSLEGLIKFANSLAKETDEDGYYPELILTRSIANNKTLCLEIYDDYRE